jgi:hypothetical protein
VFAIFISACVAGYEAVARLIEPREVEQLGALAAAGALGFAGRRLPGWRASASWLSGVIAAALTALALAILA